MDKRLIGALLVGAMLLSAAAPAVAAPQADSENGSEGPPQDALSKAPDNAAIKKHLPNEDIDRIQELQPGPIAKKHGIKADIVHTGSGKIIHYHGTNETHVRVIDIDTHNNTFNVKPIPRSDQIQSLEKLAKNKKAPAKARAKAQKFLKKHRDRVKRQEKGDASPSNRRIGLLTTTERDKWGFTNLISTTATPSGERLDMMAHIDTNDPAEINIADTYMWADMSYS